MISINQARALQAAIKTQASERNRLIAAGSDHETRDAAEAYLVATDAAYLVACTVKGHTPADVLAAAANSEDTP